MSAVKLPIVKLATLTITLTFIWANIQMIRFYEESEDLRNMALYRRLLQRSERSDTQRQKECSSLAIGYSKVKVTKIALASYPGAGNTWLRHLIEHTSGTYTSSIYCDETLLPKFPGECSVNGSTIVVKTHAWPRNSIDEKFEKAVILIRSPYRCFRSMFNYMITNDNHTGVASEELYKRKFQNVMEPFLPMWSSFYIEWIDLYKGPKHFVYYDDLKTNLKETVKKLMVFLNVNLSDTRLDCTMHHKEGSYHRKQTTSIDVRNYLSADQIKQLEDEMNEVDNKVRELTNEVHIIRRN